MLLTVKSWSNNCKLVTTSIRYYCAAGLQLASVSSNYSKSFGSQCHLVVQLTCTVQNLTSLRWWFDDDQISTYIYSQANTFPHTPPGGANGIQIQIIRAARTAGDRFNATSVLTTNSSVLGSLKQQVDNIQCGTNAIRSQSINILEWLELNGKEGLNSKASGMMVYNWEPVF